ncbi:MAG: pyridoxal phosphate-dependent aminotransferase [Ruminococcaceae bacterium]|nr:pyridoxal phosphate-dependent aminotransferase [Oscillospiraceae bacterium]
MLSQKMLELGKKSSVIREIFEYGRVRKAEIGVENVFDFSLGNPSVPAPQKVTDVMNRLIAETPAEVLHGYTSGPGDLKVRTAIAENIKTKFQVEATPGLIYMTCGAAASLTIALNAIAEEGDEVIAFAPFFPEYRVFVEQSGAKFVPVSCKNDDLQIDFDLLEKSITPNTKAVIINSPNNPSGVIVPEKDVIKLAALLNEKQKEYGKEIFLISDEPYRELVFTGEKVAYIPAYYDNSFVCYSYSKALSLPGERIGYIFVSPTMKDSSDVFAAVCGAGRALGYVCAPSLMQYTISECLNNTADVSVYEENRKILYEGLTDIGYTVIKPDGAFYMFVKSLEEDAYKFYERAKKFELLLVPSDDFGCPGFVRLAYCVDTDLIKRSLNAFKELYEDYKND